MTKYMPHYDIGKLLHEKSEELRKRYQVYSMWYYEAETKTITICTTQPGFWIGRYGKDVEDLLNEIKAIIKESNEVMMLAYESGKINFKPNLCDEVEHINFIECSN